LDEENGSDESSDSSDKKDVRVLKDRVLDIKIFRNTFIRNVAASRLREQKVKGISPEDLKFKDITISFSLSNTTQEMVDEFVNQTDQP
jgi:hypothetical protein